MCLHIPNDAAPSLCNFYNGHASIFLCFCLFTKLYEFFILCHVDLIFAVNCRKTFSVLFDVLHELTKQNKVFLNDVDILRFSVHMLINLLADIGHDQRSIAANDSPLVFFISGYLA